MARYRVLRRACLRLSGCVLALLPAIALADTTCPEPVPAPPAEGLCRVVPNTGASLLLQGLVLQEGGALANGQVLVGGDGLIACVGCDCSDSAGYADAVRVECPDGAISPGLIDAMNRLGFAHNAHHVPADPATRYEHRHQWRLGQEGRPQISATSNSSTDYLRWAELRSVLAGVTAAITSNATAGFLRNLQQNADAAAVGEQEVDTSTFPLGDSDGTTRTDSCTYPGIEAPAIGQRRSHVIAEGIDCRARNEFLCLSGQRISAEDAIPDSAVEQGLGLTTGDLELLRSVGGSLTWHPRSQVSLYGMSAPVLEALALGLPVAIGTNWTPTGSMHLGRELACARSLDQQQLGGRIGDRALWRMATSNGARAAGMGGAIGTLEVGAVGDILVVGREGGDGYTAVVTADTQDIALVLRGGTALYGDAALVAALGATDAECDVVDVCGTDRRVCVGRETGGARSFATLAVVIGSGSPPAFFCAAPAGERTCTPSRAEFTGLPVPGDADGDGVADAQDNCPTTFNPLRTIDLTCPHEASLGGPQADIDGDGIGDACDRCPLVTGEDACLDSLLLLRDGFESPTP